MQAIHPSELFTISGKRDFDELALRAFRWQASQSPVYQEYISSIGIKPSSVEQVESIPMLPIELFKKRKILTAKSTSNLIFRSSGTTGQIQSEHHIHDVSLYEKSFLTCFARFFGTPNQYRILGLLPSYIERGDSSLVYMVNELIERSGDKKSGMYLNRFDDLMTVLEDSEATGKPTLLIGVSFALLDLAAAFPSKLQATKIIETGGMKGRRKEMIREELHATLMNAFGLTSIHSEYGMTELLSQAWSNGNGLFTTPPWMQVFTRDSTDPFSRTSAGKAGGLDVIDLANIYSCPFIATQDLGKVYANGQFEVLGRFDASDVRGCNLMVY